MRAVPVLPPENGNKLPRGAMFALGCTGKVGVASGVGFGTLGLSELGADGRGYGIYQRRRISKDPYRIKTFNPTRSPFVLMKNYQPTNPRTEAQQANRSKFASAVRAWQALTETEKHNYNARAAALRLLGYHLFIKEYLATH